MKSETLVSVLIVILLIFLTAGVFKRNGNDKIRYDFIGPYQTLSEITIPNSQSGVSEIKRIPVEQKIIFDKWTGKYYLIDDLTETVIAVDIFNKSVKVDYFSMNSDAPPEIQDKINWQKISKRVLSRIQEMDKQQALEVLKTLK